jgi:hypothetical protein
MFHGGIAHDTRTNKLYSIRKELSTLKPGILSLYKPNIQGAAQ